MKKKKLRPGALALRNIKQHKKQYTAMAAGIILALVFASGFLYFFYCYRASAEILRGEEYGLEDCIIMHTNEKAVDDLQAQGMMKESGLAHILGYLYATEDCKANGAAVAWLDDTAKELANPTLLAGTWPEKDGEIAIEQTAMAQMGLKAEVGDKVTLQMQPQNGAALLDSTVEKGYVLTGILKDKRTNITESYIGNERRDLPAAFVCPGTQAEPGGLETLACYVVRSENSKQDTDAGGITGAFAYLSDPLTQYFEGKADSYMIFLFSDDTVQDISTSFTMTAMLAGIFLLAACAAIINAFNNNLQSRKKQIGMLRAVGATKGQIVKMYGVEALLITLLCVPISLLIAFWAVRGIIALLGSGFTFVPNLWVLLLCGVCGAVFVLIAALIPLLGATRISPMQAIRNISATRKMKTKRIHTKKEFRLPKLLAARRTTFSKGRQVVVSLFLAIAIITSGYVFSYITYMNANETKKSYDYALGLTRWVDSSNIVNIGENQNGFAESDRQAVLRSPYIQSSAGYKVYKVGVHIDQFTDYLRMAESDLFPDSAIVGHTDDVNGDNYQSALWGSSGEPESEDYTQYKPYMQGSNYLALQIIAADHETLEALEPYLDSGTIHTDRLDAGEEVILVAPREIGVYRDEPDEGTPALWYESIGNPYGEAHNYIATAKRDSDLAPGKELDLTFLKVDTDPQSDPDYDGDLSEMLRSLDVTDRHTQVGAVLDSFPHTSYLHQVYSLSGNSEILVLTSIDGLANLAGEVRYRDLRFTLNQPCNDEIDASVQSILNEITMRVPDSSSTSVYATDRENRANVLSLLSILLGAVVLVLFFCGAIVNNTITADIRENRRELGTLRAVGASAKELSQAYIWQLVRMLGWGSAIGLIGFAGSFFAIRLISEAMDHGTMEFIFSPWVPILFCVLLFALCSLNLYLKIKKETKHSIVDNIREL